MIKYLSILERALGVKQTIIELRREFPQHPELALQEFNTAKRVERILKSWDRNQDAG